MIFSFFSFQSQKKETNKRRQTKQTNSKPKQPIKKYESDTTSESSSSRVNVSRSSSITETSSEEERQREIEMALFSMMEKKNYVDITITEICLSLNMPRKTFYRYFDSKDDALYALIEHTMFEYSGFHERIDSSTERTLKKEIHGFFDFWIERKHFLDVFNRNFLLRRSVYRKPHYRLQLYVPDAQ